MQKKENSKIDRFKDKKNSQTPKVEKQNLKKKKKHH